MESRGTLSRLDEPSAAAGGAARPVGWWAARIAGWGLLAACVLLVVVGLLAGERTATYDDLRRDVASGEVEHVTVSPGFSGEFRGRATVDVYWRTATGWRVAKVAEQHPQRQSTRVGDLPVVYDVGEDLRSVNGAVQVERRPHWRDRSSDVGLLGCRLPAWCGWVLMSVWLGALMLVIGGPPPWRATRWAWFWLVVLAAPVGVVAFALVGGPSGLLPPAPGRRPGLRGGVGLLLAIIVGSAIGTVGT
ncbi:hypothetical protein [Nocardioides sp.]|uniref:hypothetical protein n=1 Tax=Nocardioides sp. TaxID=35761 RepID=UPI0025D5EA67|nr:hypothetical protein [Nocardioides sp.]